MKIWLFWNCSPGWPLIHWSTCFPNSGNQGVCCHCPADFHHLGSQGRKIITWRPTWNAISRPCLIKRKKVMAATSVSKGTLIKPDDQWAPRAKSWLLGGCGIPLNPSRGRWIGGQPGLLSKFQDSQGYMQRLCLKKKNPQNYILRRTSYAAKWSIRGQSGVTRLSQWCKL